MPSPEESLQELVRRIVDLVHPIRIVLFGSAARGQAGADSDLDLLVVVPSGTHRRRVAQEIYRRIGGLGIAFDVLVATPDDLHRHASNPGLIYATILAEGREIYAA
jgi:uncharacterized protein